MFFWIIFLITLIIFLTLAWLIRGHLQIFLADLCGPSRGWFYYWLVWLIIALLLSWAISNTQKEEAILGWLALIILVTGLGYSLSRGYHLSLSIFLTAVILTLLTWLAWQMGPEIIPGTLIFIVLVWFVIILIALLRSLLIHVSLNKGLFSQISQEKSPLLSETYN